MRANTESVLDLARAEGQRTTDNPARWDILKHLYRPAKARRAGHSRALPYTDMPALMKDLQADASISAVCFRFTILTVARTNESTSCPWPDIDFDARTRCVQILKGGKSWRHMIPLSTQAIGLLQGLLVEGKPVGNHVFPARNRRGHLGTSAMLDLLKRLKWKDRTTTHGIRSAFKTWATERTKYPVRSSSCACLTSKATRWSAPTNGATSSISAGS